MKVDEQHPSIERHSKPAAIGWFQLPHFDEVTAAKLRDCARAKRLQGAKNLTTAGGNAEHQGVLKVGRRRTEIWSTGEWLESWDGG